jgi:hypothetical protein
VTKELDALLTELYVLIDDHVVTPRTGRGRVPLLSDSELCTLAVAQALQGFHSERRWVRHIHSDPAWRTLFPYDLVRDCGQGVLAWRVVGLSAFGGSV